MSLTGTLAVGLALAAACPELEAVPVEGSSQSTAHLVLRAYQRFVSPADGAGCHFYPSCSRYARQAIARNGVLLGSVMATERIQRAHGGWRYEPCTSGEREFLHDPVEHNEFWREP